MKKDILKVAGKTLKSRLIVGTGKYKSFLETAHPIKFLDTVENSINEKIKIPKHILKLKKKKKNKIGIKNYEQLKSFLLSR